MTLADLLKKDNLEKYNIYDNKGNVYKYKNNELKLMKIVDDSLYSLEDLLSLEYNITKKEERYKMGQKCKYKNEFTRFNDFSRVSWINGI